MEPISVSGRIYHIDALRGVAILMMLQGHFIYDLLQDADRVGPLYEFWKFCRGLTAPVFFTTSGVVLVYLLLKKPDIEYRKLRLKKAFWRGLEVLMWGYLLRFNVLPFIMYGKVYKEFWRVDVLHCIGIGILLIGITYFIVSRLPDNLYRVLLPMICISIFIFHPWYSTVDYSSWPFGIQTYFTRQAGSVFILFPFLGYLFMGAFLGSLYVSLYIKRKYLFIATLYVLGYVLLNHSSWLLIQLYDATGVQLFQQVAWNNFGFMRIGQVLLVYASFMLAEPILSKMPTLNKIGQHTLTVYIIHFFILFGSWFGLGIDDILFDKRSLPAEAVIPGALLFIVLVCWLTLKYHSWKDRGYNFGS